ncbi:MAG: prepilin-type N-terminal cleavage/methylation domain-containing protein [Alphaproteobacteria bacterium]
MTKKLTDKIKAFSLIEMSIVILIIGFLVSGISQGALLIRKMRLQTAQNITASAPVLAVNDLVLWLETSLETSFNSSERINNAEISSWLDNSGQTTVKNNATSPAGNRPVFIENAFNRSIPAIRFDGVNDYFNYNGSILISRSFTFFVVEQRRIANAQYFIGGAQDFGNDVNFHMGYGSSTGLRVGNYGNNAGLQFFDLTVPAFTSPVATLHTFIHNNNVGKKYWYNGGINPDASNTYAVPLAQYNAPTIGLTTGIYYNGDIAEIIIFSRALDDGERQAIEGYLSRKYSIVIS